jgi:mannose-6-phosphate isomerase-like protein (cupin superfamily)
MKKMTMAFVCAVFVVAAFLAVAAQQPAKLTTSKYLGHETIGGCAKAGTFVNTPEYIVQCSNRTGPGVVEIHVKESDMIYVIDGEATFVTDGKGVNVKNDDPLQPRGTNIEGGVSHHLTKGDVIVVPAGQPHWFKEVPKSVSYYVVKVLKP